MKWVGPYTINELLDNTVSKDIKMPPNSDSVYAVTMKPWLKKPNEESIPLYIGSTTGVSKRFRTRIGDLIADMFGFYTNEAGHHSGGQHLHKYILEKKLDPKQLYIGWLKKSACNTCAEYSLYQKLSPLLNRNTPPRCKEHK